MTNLPLIECTVHLTRHNKRNDKFAPYTHTVYKWRNFVGLRQNLSHIHYTAKRHIRGATFDFEKVKGCAEAQTYVVLREFDQNSFRNNCLFIILIDTF